MSFAEDEQNAQREHQGEDPPGRVLHRRLHVWEQFAPGQHPAREQGAQGEQDEESVPVPRDRRVRTGRPVQNRLPFRRVTQIGPVDVRNRQGEGPKDERDDPRSALDRLLHLVAEARVDAGELHAGRHTDTRQDHHSEEWIQVERDGVELHPATDHERERHDLASDGGQPVRLEPREEAVQEARRRLEDREEPRRDVGDPARPEGQPERHGLGVDRVAEVERRPRHRGEDALDEHQYRHEQQEGGADDRQPDDGRHPQDRDAHPQSADTAGRSRTANIADSTQDLAELILVSVEEDVDGVVELLDGRIGEITRLGSSLDPIEQRHPDHLVDPVGRRLTLHHARDERFGILPVQPVRATSVLRGATRAHVRTEHRPGLGRDLLVPALGRSELRPQSIDDVLPDLVPPLDQLEPVLEGVDLPGRRGSDLLGLALLSASPAGLDDLLGVVTNPAFCKCDELPAQDARSALRGQEDRSGVTHLHGEEWFHPEVVGHHHHVVHVGLAVGGGATLGGDHAVDLVVGDLLEHVGGCVTRRDQARTDRLEDLSKGDDLGTVVPRPQFSGVPAQKLSGLVEECVTDQSVARNRHDGLDDHLGRLVLVESGRESLLDDGLTDFLDLALERRLGDRFENLCHGSSMCDSLSRLVQLWGTKYFIQPISFRKQAKQSKRPSLVGMKPHIEEGHFLRYFLVFVNRSWCQSVTNSSSENDCLFLIAFVIRIRSRLRFNRTPPTTRLLRSKTCVIPPDSSDPTT